METEIDETSQQEKHVIKVANEIAPENTNAKKIIRILLKGNFLVVNLSLRMRCHMFSLKLRRLISGWG